ncbi:MAG: glycosyltransferase family 2 protein [Candidatus Omnitrophica bacterium]|nr:glycosyltransferase family 2 protein [Candidatus Omnitrophota bacterium]MBU2473241.1 glycosyltransferase family 2 protein [Candidatus Omnitrophota bacterium]
MSRYPKVTFGIIVLNGEPFTSYCLRSLYPFAYEIIVVEGGHEGAKKMCTHDGHSIDSTLESLWRFKKEEDPENKVQIVTRDGFWPKLDELGRCKTPQSRAYAEKATGDYLWQVDIDEFYKPEDMQTILKMLEDDPEITAVSFKQITFWGNPNCTVDGWPLRRGEAIYHRLFKWGPGYRYVTHQPPTIDDERGQDLRSLKWVKAETLAKKKIYMYHYSLLFPWQVKQKAHVYQAQSPQACPEIVKWAENNYFRISNPYRVHNLYQYPSWLERFSGDHPPQVRQMMEDIHSGKVKTALRPTDDIEALLNSRWYSCGRFALKIGDLMDRNWKQASSIIKGAVRKIIKKIIVKNN